MKRIFLLLVVTLIFHGTASAISMFGKQFTFSKGVTEWSDPLTDEMRTDEMDKKGIAPIPISVRVRVVRKIFRGCRYEVEVTNSDPTRTLKFKMDNNGKMKRLKLKGGATEIVGIDTLLDKNCPDVDACGNGTCEFAVRFFDVDVDK